MKNRFSIILSILLLFSGYGIQAQTVPWKWLNPTPEGGEPMYDIEMPDEQTMVACGRNGNIMRSADGGLNWSVIKAAESDLFALDFADAQHGWACGKQGALVKTSDGGLSWTTQTVPGNFDFNDVDFADPQNGWLAGPGVILKTSNGGISWENVSPGTFFYAGGIHFINAQEGWFCGTIGMIMHTTDGGNTWTSQVSNTPNELRDIRFLNNQTGWACGLSGTILKTSDGGINWAVQPSGISLVYLNCIAIKDAQTVWVGGQDGTLLKTSNGGSVWSSVYPFQIYMDLWGIEVSGSNLFISKAPPINFPGIGQLKLSLDEGLSWQQLTKNMVPAKCNFRDVLMRTPEEFWAMGNSIDSGFVLKSVNAGQTWTKKGFSRGINAGAMHNADLGWIAGANNQIYKTTDGGAQWINQTPSNVSADFYDIQLLNDQTLWVAGYDDNDEGVAIKSTDGGQSWTNVQGIANEAINSIFFIDDQKGWAVGNGGVIRKTSDGGQTWASVSIESEFSQLKSVCFTSAGTGYIVGENGRSYKTTDGGQNWNTAGLGGFKGLVYNKIQFIHPDTGFAVRSDGKIFKTVNAAESWTEAGIAPARQLFAMNMLSSRRGIIGGESAAILSSNGILNTGLPNLLAEDGIVFSNPAKDYITLKFKGRITDAEITGMDGRKVPALFSSENKLDISSLKPGMYLIRIQTAKGLFLRKILVN